MPVAWMLVVVGSVAAGASVVGLLVVRPRLEPLAFASAIASSLLAGWGLLNLAGAYDSFARVLLAAGLGLAATVGGYWLAAAMLPMLNRTPADAEQISPPSDEADTGPAYVLLSRAEPERYSESWTAAFINGVADLGSGLVPLALMPFLFAAEKARYRAVQGVSPARQTVKGLANRLARSLRVSEVRVAYSEPADSLAKAVRSAVLAGHRTVVVAPLVVGEGGPEEAARSALEELDPSSAGVKVVYAEPLWSSERLARHVAQRALTFVANDDDAGVALVLEGQPPVWEEAHPEFDQQEATFAGRVTGLIIEGGVPETRVRTAWLDWGTPDVIESVRHLDALECNRIALLPVTAPTETLITMLDMPRAAETARVEAETRVLPPWGDESVVAEEIAETMRKALEDGAR